MTAVGSPARALVAASRVRREIDDVLRGRVHDIEIVVAIGAAPTKGEELAVGRPCWIDDIALVRKIEQVHVGAVGVHHIELRNTAAVADKDDRLAGLGVPGRRSAAARGEREALGFAAVDVGDEEFGIAEHGRGEHDLRSIGRPGRGAVGAAKMGEGDDFPSVHRVHADLGVNNAIVGLVAGEGYA